MPDRVCPICLRRWVPLGKEPAECPACRRGIGLCALVGGEVRERVEEETHAAMKEPLDYVLDSPDSRPKALDEFAARGFRRINRATAKGEPRA